LEYTNLSQTLKRLDADWIISNYPILDDLGRPQLTNMLTEAGLESLILGSRKAIAKEFGAWIKAEIIEKTKDVIGYITDLKAFVSEEGNPLRVWFDTNGNPHFMAIDICRALLHTNPRKAIADHCKKDGVTKRYVIDTLGRHQEATFINEGNLYRLVAGSTKPEAQSFADWIFDDILPTLRKTGRYEMSSKAKEEENDLAIKVVNVEEQEQAMYKTMQRYIDKTLSMMLSDAIKNEVLPLLQEIRNENEAIKKELKQIALDNATFKKIIPSLNPSTPLLKPSYVYLGHNALSGLHKIGKADKPLSRTFQLEAGGGLITIIAVIKFSSPALALMWERTLHQTFSEYHVGREWFRLSEYHITIIQNFANDLDGLF